MSLIVASQALFDQELGAPRLSSNSRVTQSDQKALCDDYDQGSSIGETSKISYAFLHMMMKAAFSQVFLLLSVTSGMSKKLS